jgi:hypothetical protein
MFRSILLFLLAHLFFQTMSAQPKTDALLENILRNAKNPSLDTIINHAQKFRCQIIYTQINRDKIIILFFITIILIMILQFTFTRPLQ